MNIAKKNDGLSVRNLLQIFRLNDPDNSGQLDEEFFTKSLKQYG